MDILKPLRAVKEYICNGLIWNYFNYESKNCILPTRLYVPRYYFKRMGEKMDVKHPKSLSEKLNWLKIYYHDPLMTVCADKYRMREYVKHLCGDGYTVPLIGKWDKAEDIDFNELPNQFVLKTNHDGGPIVCLDKKNFDFDKARKQLDIKLKTSKYMQGREWGYKNIKRCIIAEQLIGDGVSDLIDYKFFCFNGEPKYLYTVSEHVDSKHGNIDFFDMDFNSLPFKMDIYENAQMLPQKPLNFEKMIEFSKKLSTFGGVAFPFVRVDFYEVEGQIYVGELTFYPTNGMISYAPDKWNTVTGNYMNLPKGKEWKKRDKLAKNWIKNTLKI